MMENVKPFGMVASLNVKNKITKTTNFCRVEFVNGKISAWVDHQLCQNLKLYMTSKPKAYSAFHPSKVDK